MHAIRPKRASWSALERRPGGRLYLIPASEETRGHGTTGMAKFWNSELQAFLASVSGRAMERAGSVSPRA